MEYQEYQSPSFLEAYINAFKYCLDFDDRSRRAEYWKFVGIYDFVILCLWAASKWLDSNELFIITGIFVLVHLLPLLAVLARRLHDSGHSAKWILGMFIPYVGIAVRGVILVFTLMNSGKEDNDWGESPKYYTEDE